MQWNPLDLAVIKHIAQYHHHAFKAKDLQRQNDETHQFLDEVFKEFMGIDPDYFDGGLKHVFDENMYKEPSTPKPTERNIILLLQLGAQSIGDTLFPSEKSSALHPFSSESGYEEMSLSDYCTAHQECFSPQLLDALAKYDAYAPEPAIT